MNNDKWEQVDGGHYHAPVWRNARTGEEANERPTQRFVDSAFGGYYKTVKYHQDSYGNYIEGDPYGYGRSFEQWWHS